MLKQGDAHKKRNPHSVEHAAGAYRIPWKKEMPMKKVKRYVWLMLMMLLIIPAPGCNDGGEKQSLNSIAQPQLWCVEQSDQYQVQEVENCRIEPTQCEEGDTDCVHWVCDYGDIVGSCPLDQDCGAVMKLVAVESSDPRNIAATYYQFDVVYPHTTILPPEEVQKLHNWDDQVTTVQGDPTGIMATFETWIGCQARQQQNVTEKGTFCLGGKVFQIISDFPWLPNYTPELTCTCNGESTTYRGFDLCTDFDCPLDADPNFAPKRCPNFGAPDGDEETGAEGE